MAGGLGECLLGLGRRAQDAANRQHQGRRQTRGLVRSGTASDHHVILQTLRHRAVAHQSPHAAPQRQSRKQCWLREGQRARRAGHFRRSPAENEHLAQLGKHHRRYAHSRHDQRSRCGSFRDREARAAAVAARALLTSSTKANASSTVDGHMEVAQAYYSVPPEYMGHTVWVRWDSHLVRILNAQFVEIRLHARQEPGRFRTAPPISHRRRLRWWKAARRRCCAACA